MTTAHEIGLKYAGIGIGINCVAGLALDALGMRHYTLSVVLVMGWSAVLAAREAYARGQQAQVEGAPSPEV